MPPLLSPSTPLPGTPSAAPAAASLVEWLAWRVAESRDRQAVVDGLPAQGSIQGTAPRNEGPAAVHAWTWGDLAAAALHLAGRFQAAGLRPGDRVAHLGPHGVEWIVVDLACLLSGVVQVALHADATAAEQESILEWLDPRGVVCGGAGPRLRAAAGRIVVDPGADPAGWRPLAADPALLDDELRRRVAACDPDACCTILLSSGTTGRPHGVMHSQRSLAANATAAAEVFLDDPRDVRLSWLPLSHALARTGDLYTALVRGGCLNVVRDRLRVLEACRALPPTVVLGVPAFFERLESGVRSGRIADLRAALGGSIRVCVSGGAALRRRTAECFAAAGVPLVEGYGLAEAGPVVALSNPRIARPGTVGPPLAGVEVRLDGREESRGQLLVKTPSRALGVLRPPEPGAAAVVEEPVSEWLATGDLAEIDEAGQVRITGRLRDTLVLSSGVKLPPAAVEHALAEDDAVAQVCVVGNGLPWPVAVVVPEPAVLRAALRRMGVRVFSRAAALAHPRVLAWLARRLARRQRDLPRSWQVRRAFLLGRPFDAAHGEATESLKLKRGAIEAHLGDRIAAAAAGEPPAWACVVPVATGGPKGGTEPPRIGHSWIARSLWGGARGRSDGAGFAEAAARAAAPLGDAVTGVLEQAEAALARLRAEAGIYDAAAVPPGPRPPLADAPPPPTGRFSAAAEAALGQAGLWGLAVPQAFGGAGASVLELARAITRVAADCPTAAGMLAVHSSIGAVSAVAAFGTAGQQARHLPGLAEGRPLSIFGGTEPEVGCDLAAVRAVLERRDGKLLLTGTKMFITNAVHGRLVKVLATCDGRPVVILVRLPDADGPTFRLRRYDLHPLKHAHNAALEFAAFEVDEADVLEPPPARDGMAIVWHGLNRGRVTLAAQAAGTLRLLLAQARDHARRRSTWAAPIGSRQLVQGRLARIAAGIVACDGMAAWAATAIDAGGTGELEAIAAKITASTCVRDGAIDALGIHGGRAFLVGHPLGDSLHDHFAVTVYEGESDLLGLALFKGLAKHHPLAGRAGETGPLHRAAGWLAWRAAGLAAGAAGRDRTILDARLRGHARSARRLLTRSAVRIDRAIRRHGRGLAERQLEVGGLAAEVRELASVLAVAHHADAAGDEATVEAAECWCRLALARSRGRAVTAADHAALAALGRGIVAGTAAFPAPR